MNLLLLAALAAGEAPPETLTQPVPKPMECFSPAWLASFLVSFSLQHGPGFYMKPTKGKDGNLVFLVQFEGDRTVVAYPFNDKGCLGK